MSQAKKPVESPQEDLEYGAIEDQVTPEGKFQGGTYVRSAESKGTQSAPQTKPKRKKSRA